MKTPPCKPMKEPSSSRRDDFAMAAMQSLILNEDYHLDDIPSYSVKLADKIIEVLDR